jgi:putrescine transport system substrate-binding protein
VKNDPSVYPKPEVMEKLFTLTVKEPKLERVITRSWTKLKTGR